MSLKQLLDNNRAWAKDMVAQDKQYFSRLAQQQSPQYLWIGCSDSRVPANQITGLAPGEVFVHRNIANVVVHTDLNCLSVIQFAVDILKVRHIILCGHYGCSGVEAAMTKHRIGLSDNWLRHVQDVAAMHKAELDKTVGQSTRHRRLCELNVREQVQNITQCTAVQEAWERGQPLEVHGWIYDLKDGLITDMKVSRAS
ncbi:carbonic anhydrase [Betaproteobacteria bacterium SCGC AG-212-J23]|nr:carbonic anhydrase [Betaproteobacteria bacterium SCGC AG-212-J23]